ncbi:hypothetical protein RSOLAG22IIIB_05798 [Rhizoctonia solani]|uniref:Uncharacterized protein n=1 Tax=Rhizoctonia solani TaxID=456999 RepID=A0A0K6G9G5_9AGAM|nr:hypothetical protein RSOLAG22IIIB_05798 [Rhizoctonia solani]
MVLPRARKPRQISSIRRNCMFETQSQYPTLSIILRFPTQVHLPEIPPSGLEQKDAAPEASFVDSNDGINTRLGAQLLVENNVWEGVKKPLYATDRGFAVARGNDFGGASNSAPAGTFSKAPYDYTLLEAGKVKSSVSSAGATLSF